MLHKSFFFINPWNFKRLKWRWELKVIFKDRGCSLLLEGVLNPCSGSVPSISSSFTLCHWRTHLLSHKLYCHRSVFHNAASTLMGTTPWATTATSATISCTARTTWGRSTSSRCNCRTSHQKAYVTCDESVSQSRCCLTGSRMAGWETWEIILFNFVNVVELLFCV